MSIGLNMAHDCNKVVFFFSDHHLCFPEIILSLGNMDFIIIIQVSVTWICELLQSISHAFLFFKLFYFIYSLIHFQCFRRVIRL